MGLLTYFCCFCVMLFSAFTSYTFSDTQEAPKSLGLDSSSSTESLNEIPRTEPIKISFSSPNGVTNQQPLNPPISVLDTVKILNMSRPPLPFRRAPILLSRTGGAFKSYVRRRGEPDGGHSDTEASVGGTLLSHFNNTDHSQNNTTDSELSDGYTSQTLNKFEPKPKMGYSSLRGPVKVGRPGGGGESDAAFTPSPPVAVDNNVSLALAHQTRIRNLYSSATAGFSNNGENSIQQSHHNAMRRPDSSSSASSTTDWEGSGHATVLRRSNQTNQAALPPLPPPRQMLPLVDSLRPLAPLAPVYNNLGISTSSSIPNAATLESTSSDSEFERGFKIPNTVATTMLRVRNQQQFLSRKISSQINFIDRLSVRTELNSQSHPNSVKTSLVNPRKPPAHVNLPDDDESSLSVNANKLYFSPTESLPNSLPKKESSSSSKEHKNNGIHTINIQDSILRHMNREMTPTISEVYHERNLGLGLAPPLSKLLLSKNYEDADVQLLSSSGSSNANLKDNVADMIDVTNAISEVSITTVVDTKCGICTESVCRCKGSNGTATIKKSSSSKPWLSNVVTNIVKVSDISTDILERPSQVATATDVNGGVLIAPALVVTNEALKRTAAEAGSIYSDLSPRDEGDGRSVADSQC